jgi:uncharacterized membrane protein YccF (DUF307 family)
LLRPNLFIGRGDCILVTGLLLSLTIIGIPLGIADFKMAGAAFVPFGKEVVNISDLEVIPSGANAVPEER